jgi:hypothetical protein
MKNQTRVVIAMVTTVTKAKTKIGKLIVIPSSKNFLN